MKELTGRADTLRVSALCLPERMTAIQQGFDSLLSATAAEFAVLQAALQIARGNHIRMIGIGTHLTTERLLRGAISTRGEVAVRALLRGVGRLNLNERDATFGGTPVQLLDDMGQVGGLQIGIHA